MLFTMYSRSAGESSGNEKSTESRSCGGRLSEPIESYFIPVCWLGTYIICKSIYQGD